MTAGSARAFLPALREVEPHLQVPLPIRMRILAELEFDLEELRARFVAQGLSQEEARRRAVEALVPDRPSLKELRRLHSSLYDRATLGLREDRLRVLERSALAVAVLLVLMFQALVLVRTDLLAHRSPFLWPVVGLGALIGGAVCLAVFDVWIRGRHPIPHRGPWAILLLSGATLATGIVGGFVDLYRLAALLEADPALAGVATTSWLVGDAILLAVSLLIASAGGLAWFVLTQCLNSLREARAEVLGLHPENTH